MAEQRVADIMTRDVRTISPDTLTTDATKQLIKDDVSGFPVVENDRLVGVVTESDLIMPDVKLEFPSYISFLDGVITAPGAIRKFEERLQKAAGANVRAVMTTDVKTIDVDASVEDAATLIIEHHLPLLPVVDNNQLVGVLTKHDIVKAASNGDA